MPPLLPPLLASTTTTATTTTLRAPFVLGWEAEGWRADGGDESVASSSSWWCWWCCCCCCWWWRWRRRPWEEKTPRGASASSSSEGDSPPSWGRTVHRCLVVLVPWFKVCFSSVLSCVVLCSDEKRDERNEKQSMMSRCDVTFRIFSGVGRCNRGRTSQLFDGKTILEGSVFE